MIADYAPVSAYQQGWNDQQAGRPHKYQHDMEVSIDSVAYHLGWDDAQKGGKLVAPANEEKEDG